MIIIAHIETFNPVESHYHREKSKIRYLPRDLTFQTMYNDFSEKYPGVAKRTKYFEVSLVLEILRFYY